MFCERGEGSVKLTFLGTGAADWQDKKAKESGELRRFSSALIDDVLLIDPGPHVFDALEAFGIDVKKIRYIISTHDHSDHFCIDTVKRLESAGAVLYHFSEGDSKKIGNYTVNAYRGNHATCAKTVHFMIADGPDTLFYALDGAWLCYEEFMAIKEFRPDLAVLDATIGDVDGDYRIFEHNNLNMVIEMKKSLDPYIKKFCISHMSKNLHGDHTELVKKMRKHDIIAAYDGLTLRF